MVNRKQSTGDPFKPSATLLCKLGSAVVHADEYFSDKGHEIDRASFVQLLNDPEVQDWIKVMDAMAMLPKKR